MPLLGFPPGAVVDGPEVWRRDAYGFAVRPQHLQRFREYAKIYKEEEEERAHRWRDFLDRLADAANVPTTPSVSPYASTGDPASGAGQAQENSGIGIHCDDEEEGSENAEHNNNLESPKESDASAESREANGKSEDLKDVTNLDKLQEKTGSSSSTEAIKALEGLMETNGDFEELKDLNGSSEELEEENNGNMEKLVELFLDKGLLDELKPIKVESQRRVRAALSIIDKMMSSRVVKGGNGANGIHGNDGAQLTSIEEEGRTAEASDDGDPAEVESCVAEKVELGQETTHDSTGTALDGGNDGSYFPWREELESLVRGGVPMALRGEIWQAFVGVGARRIPGYYNKLLDDRTETLDEKDLVDPVVNEQGSAPRKVTQPEKWKGQIEKDLPRTFPGHPALDEDGRNALRRLLTAYARHNPSVGYCQAMNFFAGLFLLFMPEENAFWALVGVIDDYFDGYYTEEMIESQVDQLVLEEVVRERFPKLGSCYGYYLALTSIAIFFSQTYGILGSSSGMDNWTMVSFNFHQYASMGKWLYSVTICVLSISKTTLALLDLYGPALVTTKDAGDAITLLQSLAGSTFDSSQLVLTACMGFQSVREMGLQELRKKYRPEILTAMEERSKDRGSWKDKKGLATKLYSFKHDPSYVCSPVKSKEGLDGSKVNGETGPANLETYLSTSSILDNDLDQGVDLQDQVEKLETEAYELRKAFSDKQEQEQVMLQILLRMEQEQKVAEDARIAAERDAAEQKHAAHLLQEKYEAAMTALSQMEKRAVMAETMLEATKQYQGRQNSNETSGA
ncbi:Ypt/Rab-GAP domain of gyp1p superfamily protein [Zea mays]|uniref:Ypt/Rab-GAP domain of gyp1p superfamily protein n=1 Tax=Zea mays TaxID=4577 RepID=A0A1D6JYP6_MAIZE|nr:Ypt/Rab-GAP domain of gyp1p superfamily protein [Zea mays]